MDGRRNSSDIHHHHGSSPDPSERQGPGPGSGLPEPRNPGPDASDSLGSGPVPSGSEAFVVGVDGGGTGSRALLTDLDGVELASAQGPPALVDPENPQRAAEAVSRAVRAAAEAAGAALPARALWAGLAGAGRQGAREGVEIALRSLRLAHTVRVGMDVEGAHWDAFQDGPGALLVLGTGSMVWGRDPEGREVRVGGWGSLLGDEGGGYWVGLQALRAVARSADGRGPATLLTSLVLEEIRLPDSPALISWAAAAEKGRIAALAPLVFRAAGEGDGPAEAIVDEALAEVRRHLEVIRRAWEPWGPPVPLALVGGLVEEGGALRERVSSLLREMGGVLSSGPVSPTRGAAGLARGLLAGA